MADTNILVVEDQRAVAGALRMRLRGLGYDVLDIAKDAEEAIAKAGSLRPDLILMDIRLGDGMDGIEAAQQIRAEYDIPVVYVTAYADRDLLERARATHPVGFINKPFTTKDLLTTINFALNRDEAPNDVAARQPASRLHEAVLTTDREGRISFISNSAETLTGWSRQAVLGQTLASVLSSLYALSAADAARMVERALQQGDEEVLQRHSDDGQSTRDLLTPLSDGRGNHFGLALRFGGDTVETSFAAVQRLADATCFVLDQLPYAVVLLDRNLKITQMNRCATRLIERDASVHIRNGHLHALDDERHEALCELVRDALHHTESQLMILVGAEGAPRIIAVATAVPPSEAFIDARLVSLFLFDVTQRPDLSASVLREIYGLTRSEVNLVQSLVGGCSLENGAAELGISVNTARTHLKHVFHKTGARRQSELIHQVETGPASLPIEVGGLRYGNRSPAGDDVE